MYLAKNRKRKTDTRKHLQKHCQQAHTFVWLNKFKKVAPKKNLIRFFKAQMTCF